MAKLNIAYPNIAYIALVDFVLLTQFPVRLVPHYSIDEKLSIICLISRIKCIQVSFFAQCLSLNSYRHL